MAPWGILADAVGVFAIGLLLIVWRYQRWGFSMGELLRRGLDRTDVGLMGFLFVCLVVLVVWKTIRL